MKRLCLILITICLFLNVYAPELNKEVSKINSRAQFMKYQKFSEENLKEYLSYFNVQYSDIIISQARLETGYYTSWLFINNNNLFGMRHPKVRKTTSLGSKYNHAYYHHWTDCVDDYILWYKYHQHRINNCYYKFLKEIGYAEDVKYIKKLKKLI